MTKLTLQGFGYQEGVHVRKVNKSTETISGGRNACIGLELNELQLSATIKNQDDLGDLIDMLRSNFDSFKK